MKTLEELNQKWWYRLIKVLYFLVIVVLILSAVAIIYDTERPVVDNKESYIKCENGKRFMLNQTNISLYYDDYLYTDEKAEAQKLCVTKITPEQAQAELDRRKSLSNPPPSFIDKTKPVDLEKYRINYELVTIYNERNWFNIIGYSLLAIFSITLFFEVLRRIFYYVTLGSVRPKKN